MRSTKTGYVGGAFVTIKFSDKIAIQGDLLYSQQGVELDVDKINLDYINFPLVLKYYIILACLKKQKYTNYYSFTLFVLDYKDNACSIILLKLDSV